MRAGLPAQLPGTALSDAALSHCSPFYAARSLITPRKGSGRWSWHPACLHLKTWSTAACLVAWLPACLRQRCSNAEASLLLGHTSAASSSLSTHAHVLQQDLTNCHQGHLPSGSGMLGRLCCWATQLQRPAACQLMPLCCSGTGQTVIKVTHQRSILCAGGGRGRGRGRQRTLDAFRSQGAGAATSGAGDDDGDVDSVPPSQVQ